MRVNFLAERFPLLRRNINFRVDIQRHQLFARLVAQHLHECVVAIEQLAFRSRDKHALLHLLEKQPVALFRAAPVRGIANDVNRSLLLAALLRVGGG